jgi:polyhydroxyalkanoate synthase subunit PhaC
VGQTPKEVVWRAGRSKLWRYPSDHIGVSPPLLIVYSLFNRSYIPPRVSGSGSRPR